MTDRRRHVRELQASCADPVAWFEELYAQADGDTDAIPWADAEPNPHLRTWPELGELEGLRVLIVGCGLGDDAAFASAGGASVTAFDVAPTAVTWAKRRFSQLEVTWAVEDVRRLPEAWRGAFDLVFEAYTFQVLPGQARVEAMEAVSRCVAPGGRLLVVCRGRDEHDPPGEIPWPLTRRELESLRGEELKIVSFEDFLDPFEAKPVRRFRVCFKYASCREPGTTAKGVV